MIIVCIYIYALHFVPHTAEYCLPFVRVGGLFVAAKGHDPKVNKTFVFGMIIFTLVAVQNVIKCI